MSLNNHGYGQIWVEGRVRQVHKLIWERYNGEVPAGLKVLHVVECHNRACSEITHLYLGTDKDNASDRVANGTHPSGQNNPNSKLTMDTVERMRIVHRILPRLTHRQISLAFGISRAQTSGILSGRFW